MGPATPEFVTLQKPESCSSLNVVDLISVPSTSVVQSLQFKEIAMAFSFLAYLSYLISIMHCPTPIRNTFKSLSQSMFLCWILS